MELRLSLFLKNLFINLKNKCLSVDINNISHVEDTSMLYVFSLDTLLKIHNFVLTSVNTSFLSLLLFLFLDLLHLLETPVKCWMKMMIMGIFLFFKSQKEALRVWPLNRMFALDILNICWQINKGSLFYSEYPKNVIIKDSFLSNVIFFSSYWDGLMNFLF